MKEKLSVTIDRPLVRFLDTLPGRSRSEKLEAVIRRFRTVSDDVALRKALAGHREPDEALAETEAWRRTMERDQWSA